MKEKVITIGGMIVMGTIAATEVGMLIFVPVLINSLIIANKEA